MEKSCGEKSIRRAFSGREVTNDVDTAVNWPAMSKRKSASNSYRAWIRTMNNVSKGRITSRERSGFQSRFSTFYAIQPTSESFQIIPSIGRVMGIIEQAIGWKFRNPPSMAHNVLPMVATT
jgi:hypothetical protein